VRLTFSPGRWQQVVESHEAWWRGELGRPLVNLYVRDAHDVGSEPELPMKHFTGNYDHQVPPEQIVDRWDWEFARREYVAGGYPSIWPNFGPGVVAAFLGCTPRSRESTIWFVPSKHVPASELKLEP
jgi:uncharacterized protein YndB with AHSA1/START domain